MEQIALSAQVLSTTGNILYLDVGAKEGIAKDRTYDVKMVTRVIKAKQAGRFSGRRRMSAR